MSLSVIQTGSLVNRSFTFDHVLLYLSFDTYHIHYQDNPNTKFLFPMTNLRPAISDSSTPMSSRYFPDHPWPFPPQSRPSPCAFKSSVHHERLIHQHFLTSWDIAYLIKDWHEQSLWLWRKQANVFSASFFTQRRGNRENRFTSRI